MKRLLKTVLTLAGGIAALSALVLGLNLRGEDPLPVNDAPPSGLAEAATIARGAYLARAGNCISCHTSRGGTEYAGGRGIETPFGTVFAPNLTPDIATGLGAWTESEFWRAMHHGRAKDGRLLYPAFPYTSFTQIQREDSAAIYAFLRSLAPVQQARREHQLRFPYNQQASLAVWRALYFRPATFEPQASRSAEWSRGAYLVRGIGHCAACHAERNALGASINEQQLAGGLIPVQNWFAPSLALSERTQAEFMALMKNGVSKHGAVMGPMAEVVYGSSSHLSDDDLKAMARYLRDLPAADAAAPEETRPDPATLALGGRIYEKRCADCHGARGQGQGLLYPPLADNASVTLVAPHNVIKAIQHGGFAPTTAGNPRPAGMPPFKQSLNENEIAAVATFVRQSWGNAAPAVSALDVLRSR